MTVLLLLVAAAFSYDLPVLPGYVRLTQDSQLCSGSPLYDELRARFFKVFEGAGRADLLIRCAGDRDMVLEVRHGNGKGIARFRVEASNSSKPETLAYLAAAHVARDAEAIDAVLHSYFTRNADVAVAGAMALDAGDLQSAHVHLNDALESELEAAHIYFGLYKTMSLGGHPRSAKWYLAAFLKSSGRRVKDLTEEDIAPLLAGRDSDKENWKRADITFEQYKDAAANGNWNRAVFLLRKIVVQTPWYEPAYHALARSYDTMGWKRLAKHWEGRARFVSKLNADKDLSEQIERRADVAL